jgi:hypothetical protein
MTVTPRLAAGAFRRHRHMIFNGKSAVNVQKNDFFTQFFPPAQQGLSLLFPFNFCPSIAQPYSFVEYGSAPRSVFRVADKVALPLKLKELPA